MFSSELSSSVTEWVSNLKSGDELAAERLWEFAKDRLLAAANRARNPTHSTYDEEDVAASAFAAFCEAARGSPTIDVRDRTDLWQLLLTITLNKAREKARNCGRIRRGGKVSHQVIDAESLLDKQMLDPSLQAAAQEECVRLLEKLGRDEIRTVAVLKVQGFTGEEIASQLNCTRRSVQRRLALIRSIWSDEVV